MNKAKPAVEQELQAFLTRYEAKLKHVQVLMDEAGLSHYSSGCENKRAAFDLFPASGYVKSFLGLLTLERTRVMRLSHGFKDATQKGDYNPACEFVLYLRRWAMFAEQVMRNEGETPRGVASARAKLLLDALTLDLGEERTGNLLKTTNLARLMRLLAEALDNREKTKNPHGTSNNTLRAHHNYLKALAAAQNMKNSMQRMAS